MVTEEDIQEIDWGPSNTIFSQRTCRRLTLLKGAEILFGSWSENKGALDLSLGGIAGSKLKLDIPENRDFILKNII